MTTSMPILSVILVATVAVLLGSGATWWTMRLRAERDLAVLGTERDLLRERVVDLEATVADDAQTAAALRPLGDALSRVERHVSDLERDRTSQFAALRTRMEQVHTAAGELGRATQSLAGSLNSANVRGAWGEVQLKRVLEDAGMLSRCDFDTQVTVSGPDGRQLRPDAVVRLPGDKVLVIDAKAPMTAFLQAQTEDLDPAERQQLLRDHASSLAAHLKALAGKAYWSAFPTTPEMVVCFVPSEAMLAQALAADPSLHQSALRSKVVLASPGSLFALVRTVAFTWQQDALTENARELLGLGQELYTRLSTLGSHVAAVGGSLSRSVDAYNRLVGTLESRVLVTARKLRELDLVTGDLDEPATAEAAPRQLSAVELLDAVAAEEARPELLLDPAADEQRRERDAS
ncbi:MAG: DNA recombination protein RmuC [Intrasporangiaceae bacterium]|nr:DNA recombination protein RmuC [Intrasporangiaceae bacterium]